MNLTKQERIAVFVIAIIIILALGVFMFIIPKFETVGTSTAALISKQGELVAANEKQMTKDSLRDEVITAYEQGQNVADMFFEEMTPYQADQEFRAFLAYCKEKNLNITVDDLSVEAATVSTLGCTFSDESEVMYDLKSYVTQGVAPTDEELAAQARKDTLVSMLSSTTDVGSITVSFTVTAMTQDDLLAFADAVNDYQKQESQGLTRKACMLNGFTMEYKDVTEKYQKVIDDNAAKISADALAELKKNVGSDKVAPENETAAGDGAAAGTDAGEAKNDDYVTIEDVIYSYSGSITFYSIERMQDPAAQLEAQETSAVA